MSTGSRLPFSSCAANVALEAVVRTVTERRDSIARTRSANDHADARAVCDELEQYYIPSVRRALQGVLARLDRFRTSFERSSDQRKASVWCYVFLDTINRRMQLPSDRRAHDPLFAYDYSPNLNAINEMIGQVEGDIQGGSTLASVVEKYSQNNLFSTLKLESAEIGRRRSFCDVVDAYTRQMRTHVVGDSRSRLDSWISGIKAELENERWAPLLWDLWSSRIVLLNMKIELARCLNALSTSDQRFSRSPKNPKEVVEGWMSGRVTRTGSHQDQHHCVVHSLGRTFVISRRQRLVYDLSSV